MKVKSLLTPLGLKVRSSLTPLASLNGTANLKVGRRWIPRIPFRAILLSLALTQTLPAHAESTLEAMKNKILGKQADQYRVVESGYWVENSIWTNQIAWLDDHRVLFRGGKISDFKAGQRIYGLHIWDTRTNTVTKYVDQERRSLLCYSQGYVTYPVAGKACVEKMGKFGQEKEIDVCVRRSDRDKGSKTTFEGWLTCKDHPYFPDDMREKYKLPKMYMPLLEGHGVLDVVGLHGDDRSPARWFPPNGGPPVTLPFPRHAIYLDIVYFSEWAKAYVLPSDQAPPAYRNTSGVWPTGIDQPVWLLKTDGTVERRDLPYIKWNRGISRVYVSKAGMLLANTTETPEKGLYLQRGREWIRILEGGPLPVAAAPDGCKVAAYVGGLGFEEYGLKLIDVCEKREK